MNNVKKVLQYAPKQKHTVLLLAFLLAFALSFFESFVNPGPDALLYKGLGENIFNGAGYIDNIRNDYILPPLMHPLLIGVFSVLGVNGLMFSKIFFFFGLFFSFLYLFKSTKSLIVSSALTFLIPFLLPKLNVYGVEVTLFFAVSFLFYVFIIQSKKQSFLNSAFLGLAVVFFILIRPVLLPAILVIIPVSIAWLLVKNKTLKYFLFTVSSFLIIYVGVFMLSNTQYNDSRLTSGTYSGITLYSGFNNYIDLQRTYSSDLWRELPADKMNEGLSVLNIPENGNWQMRDKTLKKEVLGFITQYPGKALGAYFWRLKKYTFQTDIRLYSVLFFVWIVSLLYVLIVLFKNRIKLIKPYDFILLSLLPLYLVFVQALFVYSGSRYLIIPALFFLFTMPEIIKEGNQMYLILRAKKIER